MEAELIKQYEPLVRYLEEPVREIVPALWHMPFVVDTGYTCSGHALAQPGAGYGGEGRIGRHSWYPHRAILELAFSKDKEMLVTRDSFRSDLAGASAERDGVTIRFDDIYGFERDHLPYSRIPGINFGENYNATVPELEKTMESVELIESLLTSFWEQIAEVVRKYNPESQIGPIKGKNFRKVINWAHWRGIFIK